jgi:hypothetical protein
MMVQNKSPSKSAAVEEIIGMTKGSRYRLVSKGSGTEPFVSVGTFKGYTVFGHDSALTILLDPEKEGEAPLTRIIPCNAVLAIDVLSFRPEDKQEEKDEVKVYFG